MTVRYLCLDVRWDALGSWAGSMGAESLEGAGISGCCCCWWWRGEVPAVDRWLLRRWTRDVSALVDDSDRGRGSGLEPVVGARRGVRVDCERMGISAVPGANVVAIATRQRSERGCAWVNVKARRACRQAGEGWMESGRGVAVTTQSGEGRAGGALCSLRAARGARQRAPGKDEEAARCLSGRLGAAVGV